MPKAYANKKPKSERPEGDFYPTSKSLIWVAKDLIEKEFSIDKPILEPCSGNGAISQELKKMGYSVHENDLFQGGLDYLTTPYNFEFVITNPPFSQWDDFVVKAKKESKKIMMIGRLNYLGTTSRLSNGIWNNLKAIYCFDRYVDYRTKERDDGRFLCGAMATAWFLWDASYFGSPQINFLSVQPYAGVR